MSKGEQRSELLMDKARKSLQRSDANRKGKRSYQAGATVGGGAGGSLDSGSVASAAASSTVSAASKGAADGRESVSIRSGQRFASDLRRATALDEQDRVQRALQPHIVKEGESHRYFGQKFGEWGPVFGLGDDATAEGDAAAGAPPPPVGDASAAPTESLSLIHI